MSLEIFSAKLQQYCRLTANSRKTLAHELGIHPSLLSHKLKGSDHRTLTHGEVKAIVKILAKWEAISSQDEALELLALVNCPVFTAQEWRTPPLNQLEGSRLGSPVTIFKSKSEAEIAPIASGAATIPAISTELRHNLLGQLSSFIGREKEIQEVKQALANSRMLTLTGAGGCGKTRLSLQVAAEVLESFPEGVWLVELAPLSDPMLIAQTIATTLGLLEQAGRPLLTTLGDYLRSRHLLLVLDNCEHLIAECARVVDTLMRTSTSLHILATSREALGLNGEITYRVPSLSLPDQHALPEVANLRDYEAVSLFIERAKAVNSAFSLNEHNAGAVVQLCRQLDGIPLALELAAARIKVLTVGQIATRLDDRFRLLTGGNRTALPRQQTLRAMVDWSYDLLNPAEQELLAHLSVFAGGWTLSAAEAVGRVNSSESGGDFAAYAILDALSGLVNKSLVQLEEDKNTGEARYSFLETIRQYGLDKLKANGKEEKVRQRHLSYYATLADELGRKLETQEQAEALKQLDSELKNVRAAIEHGMMVKQVETVFQLTANLYWEIRGYYSEGRRYLEQWMALPGASGVALGFTLFYAGDLADWQGDRQANHRYYQACLAVSKEQADKKLLLYAYMGMGSVHWDRGSIEAIWYLEQTISLCEEMDILFKVKSQLCLGMIWVEQGHYSKAANLLEETVALSRKAGSQSLLALTLGAQARRAMGVKDYGAAHRYLEEMWNLSEELSYHLGKTDSLCYRGMVWSNEASFEEARQSLEESLVLCLKGRMKNMTSNALIGVARLLSQIWHERSEAGQFEQIACLVGVIKALANTPAPKEVSQIQSFRSYYTETHQSGVLKVYVLDLAQPFHNYYNEALESARSSLDEAAFEKAFSKGQAMSLEESIAYARQALHSF